MIFTEKISRTHLIAHVENRKIPIIFFICKNYSNARYIMFDKLFVLVELSFVYTHIVTTLGTGTIMSCYKLQIFSTVHNFINMSHRFTWIINLSYYLVFLFETISLYQLYCNQQSYCICYYMNILYIYYCSTVVSIGFKKWEPLEILELVFKLLYMLCIYTIRYVQTTVIISECADGMQHALNEFYTYCNQWKPKLWSFQKAQHKKNVFYFHE